MYRRTYPREIPYNFGAIKIPEGYSVVWFEGHEHYQAIGPDEWESDISVNPYWCRRQAIAHAERQSKEKP